MSARPVATPSEGPIPALAIELIHAVTSRDVTTAHQRAVAIRADANRIARENEHRNVDPATGRWLALASVALACYQHLLAELHDRARALAVLEPALTDRFKAGVKTFIADRFGISDAAPSEAFDRISENFKARGEARFGGGFTFVSEVGTGDRSVTRITRCLFDDFFRANDAPELTRIFCAVDLVWAEELSHPRYGVRFERATTLAAGDDACRFDLSRR